MNKTDRDRDAMRKRDSRLADRVIEVPTLSQEKLTAEQVRYEHLRITGEYLGAVLSAMDGGGPITRKYQSLSKL